MDRIKQLRAAEKIAGECFMATIEARKAMHGAYSTAAYRALQLASRAAMGEWDSISAELSAARTARHLERKQK